MDRRFAARILILLAAVLPGRPIFSQDSPAPSPTPALATPSPEGTRREEGRRPKTEGDREWRPERRDGDRPNPERANPDRPMPNRTNPDRPMPDRREGERGDRPPGERGDRPDGERPPGEHREGDGHREMPEGFRKKLEAMSPEEREQFKANLEKWKQLSPEEREFLRQTRDGRDRREFFRRAVDDALKQTGLNLSGPDLEEFTRRYVSERRKLEEELRQEMDAHRKERMPALLEALKTEFSFRSQSGAPAPSPTPAASPAGNGA